MLRPSYDEILEKVNQANGEEKIDSKYSVVIAIAKRAREIIAESEQQPTDKIIKPVSKSINDIYSQTTVINKQDVKDDTNTDSIESKKE